MLDVSALKDLLAKKLTRPADRFAAVERLVGDHGFSERRTCRLIGANRSARQYEPVRGDDGAARERLRAIANERRRFGFRRLAIMLRREGETMNLKKIYRLYSEERLTVRQRGGRKRALGTRVRWRCRRASTSAGVSTPSAMHWPAAGGVWILNVIDNWSRE